MSISSKIALAMSADGASFEEVHNSLEKIADDYAIEFAEWICKHYETDAIFCGILDTKELLKIFKKEKGYVDKNS